MSRHSRNFSENSRISTINDFVKCISIYKPTAWRFWYKTISCTLWLSSLLRRVMSMVAMVALLLIFFFLDWTTFSSSMLAFLCPFFVLGFSLSSSVFSSKAWRSSWLNLLQNFLRNFLAIPNHQKYFLTKQSGEWWPIEGCEKTDLCRSCWNEWGKPKTRKAEKYHRVIMVSVISSFREYHFQPSSTCHNNFIIGFVRLGID